MSHSSNIQVTYRQALPEDAEQCIVLRGQTRENAFSREKLGELGITAQTWGEGIAEGAFSGHVACMDEKMVGYCFGDSESGEIVVLALLPDYERLGIGKQLLQLVVEDFEQQGFKKLFLSCASDPGVRSYGFYRHLGWQPTEKHDEAGDEILELQLD